MSYLCVLGCSNVLHGCVSWIASVSWPTSVTWRTLGYLAYFCVLAYLCVSDCLIVLALFTQVIASIAAFQCHTFQKIDQNQNQNLSVDKVQSMGNERRYIYKDPRQDSGQRNISYTRYPKKCVTQTYRDLYGDVMLVLTWMSSNMADGNQQKNLSCVEAFPLGFGAKKDRGWLSFLAPKPHRNACYAVYRKICYRVLLHKREFTLRETHKH